MARKISIVVIMMLLALVSFHCRKKAAVKGVELEIKFSESPLSDYLITDIKYTWKTSSEFIKVSQDYNVFVHFWHKNNLILRDDHTPEFPTSQWESLKEYSYMRRIFIPRFIDEFDPEFEGEETLKISAGFFSPYDRTGESKRDVLVKKVKVLPPPPDTPEVIYEDGWYNHEINPESFLKEWRWTAKEARCIVDNPHRDALLVIKGGLNIDALDDQKVIFKINDLVLDEFIPKQSYFEKSFNIKKEMLGEGDEFILTFLTDKTFIPSKLIPGSTDERELGIQISSIYFR
ncbi:MAG: hypothetical protein JSV96_07165 [Candidatus Aminicenantes bacterium]|nr:MAG: hypothetical protein JSV96_07165 [Candidatus Aminicenantes bacterium]